MMIRLPGLSNPVDIEDPIYPGSNFTWAEATRNGTRIPVDTNFQGQIIPAARITANIIAIAKELDRLRAEFGNRPIHINSWYRPPAVNRGVGGARDSQHLLGWGVDIVIEGIKPREVYRRLAKTWRGGLGDSSIFTHLDLRHLMGQIAARWNYGAA